jgi:bromodomain-containing factor 1
MSIMEDVLAVPQSGPVEQKVAPEQSSDAMILDGQTGSNGTETNGHAVSELSVIPSVEASNTNGDVQMGEADADVEVTTIQSGKLEAADLLGGGLLAEPAAPAAQATEDTVSSLLGDGLMASEHVEQPVSDARDEAPSSSLPSASVDDMAIDQPIETQEPAPTAAVVEVKPEVITAPIIESSPTIKAQDPVPSFTAVPEESDATPPQPSVDSTSSASNPLADLMSVPQTAGQVRQRDDDEENEPLAKRTKVTPEADATGTTVTAPEPSAAAPTTMAPPAAMPVISGDFDSKPMTKAQQRYLLDSVRKTKKIKAAVPFLYPVDPVAMNIPTYPVIVPNPMDLGTIEEKLKKEQYPTANSLWADIDLMVQNCNAFNGITHPVTQHGLNLRAYFNKLMQSIPKGDLSHDANAKKKAASPKPSLPRRESRHVSVTKPSEPPSASKAAAAAPAPKAAPKAAASKPKAEAKKHEPVLDSNGVPVIRRASESERPKREIIKPPPRDLPYNTAKPKKKHSQLELKFCDQVVLKELKKAKNYQIVFPFLNPVDPVAMNIPTYYTVVKKPMDFGTIEKNLQNGVYNSAKDFYTDAKLVFKNCYLFNPPTDAVNGMGHQTEAIFDEAWEKKDQWIADNQPASEPASEDESEAESSEGEVELSPEERMQKVVELQKEIARLTAEMIALTNAPQVAKPSKKGKNKAEGSKKQKRTSTSAATPSSKSSRPKKTAKAKKLTLEQKRYVSDGIMMLDEANMRKAVQMIRNGVPKLKVSFDPQHFIKHSSNSAIGCP